MTAPRRSLQQRRKAVEQFLVDVVYDRRRGHLARATGLVLGGCSHLFATIVRVREYAYRIRLLRNRPLGCLVVVVGNLTVGGTGKTPVVEKFARSLREQGRNVAILSRGYKSRRDPLAVRAWRALTHRAAPPPKIVSDGQQVLLGPEEAGDEPYMLARNLPGVRVLVDKDRVKAGEYAIRHFGVDTLLLDDGLQYMALKGSLNLVLVDRTNPFGNRRVLPRGLLREPVDHLRRASYVFLTKSDGSPSDDLRREIHRHHPGVEIVECAHQPTHLQSLDGRETQPLEVLAGARAAAFSGIAVPESFENFLREHGASLPLTRRFLDHHWFSQDELDTLDQQAREAGADFLVTTEKDAVRLPGAAQFRLPVYYLRLEIDILSGAQDFEEAVERVCFPGGVRPAEVPGEVRAVARETHQLPSEG